MVQHLRRFERQLVTLVVDPVDARRLHAATDMAVMVTTTAGE